MKKLQTRDHILLVSVLMVTQTIGWGTTFSQIGILAAPISADIGVARSVIFTGATVMYLCASVSAPMAGRLADRLGGLKLLAPGSLALAAGLLILSRCSGMMSYFLAWALFGFVLHIGLVTAAYTGLTQVMGAAAARGIGTLTLATGLCSSIFWPLSEFNLNFVTWRELIQIYALVTLLLCAPLHLWLAARYGHFRAGDADNDIPEAPAHIRPDKMRAGFNLQVAIASCGSIVTVGFGIAVIDIFTSLGAGREQAVYAGSLIGIAFVVSRGLATLWADRITPLQLSQFVYLMLPLSLTPLLICAASSTKLPTWLAVVVAIGFGLPAGLVGVLRSTFPLYLFGSAAYGSIFGRQARVTELASAVSPAGLSWIIALSVPGALVALVAVGGIACLGTSGMSRLTVKEIPENT